MISMGSIVAKLQLNIDNFTANMKNAEQQIKAVEDKFSGYDAIGGRITDLGTKITLGLTAPIAGAIGAATNLAATFEEKLSKVQAISGATGDQMTALKDKAMEMGAKTKFSAGESADAMTYMAMAGWDTQAMLEGISGIMDLAAADGLDLATTSDIVTDALTAFGLQASDSARFADVLASASSNANTNVSMLGESFKYVAPVAGSLGYSAEDTAVALGLMANAGIKGSQSGTAMRAALSRLIKPTDDVADAMEKYGLSMTNADGTMKPLSQLMNEMRTNLGGLSEAEQAQAAATLFGQEAMSGMLAIINTSDGDFEKLNNAIYNSEGVAQSMAETMQNNLKGSIEQLMGGLETLGIQIGDLIIPKLTEVVQKVSGWVDKFTEMDSGTQQVILKIAGFVAAIGPAIFLVGSAIKTFGKLQENVKLVKSAFSLLKNSQVLATAQTYILAAAQKFLNLVMSANPIGIVIMAIVALIAVFVLLWNKCDWFREFWINLWEIIKEKASAFWEWFKELFSNVWEATKAGWEAFKTGFMDLWNSIKDWFAQLWEGIKLVFQMAVDFVLEHFGGMFEGISLMFDGIIMFFQGVWESIKNIFLGALLVIIDLVTLDFDNLGSDIRNIWENIKNAFSMIWDGIWMVFSGYLQTIWSYVSGIFGIVKDFIVSIWTSVKNFFVDTWNSISTTIVNAWTNFKQTISDKCVEIYNAIIQWFNNAKNWLAGLPSQLMTIGSNMFTSMKNGVVSTVSGVYNAIVNGVQSAINWLQNLPSQAITWGRHLIEGFIQGIKNTIGALVDTVKGVGQSIRDFLGFSIPKKGPLHVYMEWMPHMIQGMTASLKDESPLLYDAAQDVAGGLSDTMNNSSIALASGGTASANPVDQMFEMMNEFMQKVSQPVAVFNIDGREFARATADDMSKELADKMR